MKCRFGLIGKKLGHSYSPFIHNELFKIRKKDASYEFIIFINAPMINFTKLWHRRSSNHVFSKKLNKRKYKIKLVNCQKVFSSGSKPVNLWKFKF